MDKENQKGYEVLLNKFATFFHASLLLHHIYICIYINKMVKLDSTEADILDVETYRFRYLTTWNMCLQCFYLALAVYIDFVRLTKYKEEPALFKRIEAISDYLFTSIIFPAGLLVSGFFWLVFNIDRELVYPQRMDFFIPSWVNHSLHTTIIALPFVEVVFRKAVPSFTSALMGMTIFSILYNVTYFVTYYQSSRWLYKIFDVLTWPERGVLVVLLYLFSVFTLWLGVNVQKSIGDKKYQGMTAHKNVLKKLL